MPARADGNAMGIARCNRLCRLAGLVILLAVTAICDEHSRLYGDFVQFYMTGLVDRAGAWDALYPSPVPGSIHNAGNILDSTQKPRADAITLAHGVDYVPYHFILPPPVALLFWPLGYFDGPTAHRLWLLVSAFAGWAVAVQAGLILQRCAGRPTRWAGLLTLLIACMPPMRRAIMVANLTPMIAATIGWGILSLLDDGAQLGTAAAIVLGTLMKYAGGVLFPIALLQRRWRTVGWTVVLVMGWCAVTAMVTGFAPFAEFATVIAPTLGRSHEMSDNICLTGFLLHALHRLPPLPAAINSAVSIARLLVLAAIILPMIRLGRDRMRDAATVCAAAMALLAWLLFFSPVAWSHYLIYLCPLWGWLACPTEKNRLRIALAWVAMGLIVLSPDQMPAPAIDPWGVHLLLSLAMMLGLAVSDLYRAVPRKYSMRPRQSKAFEWTTRLSDQSAVSV